MRSLYNFFRGGLSLLIKLHKNILMLQVEHTNFQFHSAPHGYILSSIGTCHSINTCTNSGGAAWMVQALDEGLHIIHIQISNVFQRARASTPGQIIHCSLSESKEYVSSLIIL
jgi:hypothetical protein